MANISGGRTVVRLFVPVAGVEEPDDKDFFIIQGLASDVSTDSTGMSMDATAVLDMAAASSVVVDVEHNEGWDSTIGTVEETTVLDAAPAGYPDAKPPILWVRLRIDKTLSHGRDLLVLLKRKVPMGLSVFGWCRHVVDADGVRKRVSVTLERIAITCRPANGNAWIAALSAATRVGLSTSTFDDMLADSGWKYDVHALFTILSYVLDSIEWSDYTTEEKKAAILDAVAAYQRHMERVLTQVEAGVAELARRVGASYSNTGDIDGVFKAVMLHLGTENAQTEEDSMPGNEEEISKLVLAVAALTEQVAAMQTTMDEKIRAAMQASKPAPKAMTADELLARLAAATARRRGMRLGEYTTAAQQPDYKALVKEALAAKDVDAARTHFWAGIDAARGLGGQ